MTAYLLSALGAHPLAACVLFLLTFSFLGGVWLLAYHGMADSGWIDIDETHRGPYRPPLEHDVAAHRAALEVELQRTKDLIARRDIGTNQVATYPDPDDLNTHARSSVRAYRDRAERARLEKINGEPRH